MSAARSAHLPDGAVRSLLGADWAPATADELTRLNAARVAAVTGPGRAALVDRLDRELADRGAGAVALRIAEARAHVPADLADAATRAVAAGGAHALVALGGGAAVGLAKVVAVRTGLPIVAVPTTYAGSEQTPIWAVGGSGGKRVRRSRHALPAAAVYDPRLAATMPRELAGASGMNALAHCLAALADYDHGPVARLLAGRAAADLAEHLPAASDGEPWAVAACQQSAMLAGSALALTGAGTHHRICHELAGRLDLPHAATHAALLPRAARLTDPASVRGVARLAARCGWTEPAEGLGALARRSGAPADPAALVGHDPAVRRGVAAAIERLEADLPDAGVRRALADLLPAG